jgi:hypothetical protein
VARVASAAAERDRSERYRRLGLLSVAARKLKEEASMEVAERKSSPPESA